MQTTITITLPSGEVIRTTASVPIVACSEMAFVAGQRIQNAVLAALAKLNK